MYASKINDADETADNQQFALGRFLEGSIMQAAECIYGLECTQTRLEVVRHDIWPFIACTPDGFAVHDGCQVPVEVKNVGDWNASDWEDDQFPLMYAVQIQHQLLCTGAPRAVLLACIGGQRLEMRVVERHETFITGLIQRLAEFWQCVLDRRPPTIDGSEACSRALATLYPADNGYCVELPLEAPCWLRERDEAAEQIRFYEEQKREAENRIKQALGDAAYGLAGDRVVSWKTVETKPYTVEGRVSRRLSVIKALPKGIHYVPSGTATAAIEHKPEHEANLGEGGTEGAAVCLPG